METTGDSLSPPVATVLEQDEAVLWTGRPVAWAYVFGGMVVTLPLGVVALGSALSWTRGAQLEQLPLWAKAVLLLVLVFSAHMLVLRPLLGLDLARHTYYAITERRALVVCDAWGGRVQQLSHDDGTLLVVEGPRSFGKIQFGRTARSSLDVLLFGRAAIPGFYGLNDVEQPLATLLRQRGDPPSEPPRTT